MRLSEIATRVGGTLDGDGAGGGLWPCAGRASAPAAALAASPWSRRRRVRPAIYEYLTVQPYARVIGVFTGWPALTDSSAART